jgi:hydrogenase large subunit
MDWVDVVNALKADPKRTSEIAQSISNYPKSSPRYFSDLQERIRKFVDSGQLGIFTNAYWGHSAYKLPPEVNLIGLAHYLEALEWQKEIVKIHAIFGGKNPHPNYLVGGMACTINPEESNAINAERLAVVEKLLKEANEFIEQVYIPDLMAIASYYKEWGNIGQGTGNYLSCGDLPINGIGNGSGYRIPPGAILNKNLGKVHEVNFKDEKEVMEFVHRSWYSYSDDDTAGKTPWQGESEVNYTGPKPPYDFLDVDSKYSYLKTPRWKGHPVEVGPLARVLVGYALGQEEYVEVVNEALTQLDIPASALFSTLGRTAARGLETKLIAGWAFDYFDQLIANIKNGDTRIANADKYAPSAWPKEAKGVGFTEAPRGALAHWLVINDREIANYQIIAPSTWNASPRDADGQLSAIESSIIGTPVVDPDQPLELLRTVHSFDPCMACAVHLYHDEGRSTHNIDPI